MGRGKQIEVELSQDLNTCIVTDHGYGIPHGPNDTSKEILIDLFTTAHSSGKFNTENYKKVRGLHGIGSSAVCVCSKFFKVISKRDGFVWEMIFLDGKPQTDTAIKGASTTETGTTIEFTPDKQLFHMEENESAFSFERIRDELRLTSYFIPNVTFIIKMGDKTEKFISKNGLKDFAADNIKNPLHKNFIYGYKQFNDEVEIEIFAQWTAGREQSYVFSNGALNIDGGTPISGAKAAFTRTINSLTKGDFNSDMIRTGLVYIINIRHPHPVYQNQTKTKIQNQELKGYTQTVFTEAIKDFVQKNKDDFNKIVSILTKEKKANAAAERARQQVLEATKEVEKNQKRKVFASDKLKDAEFLGENSTLLCVEGLSAGASLTNARTPNFGVLMLRGKPLNVLTNDEEKIYQNEEIKLLLSAMNIVPGKYNVAKLRYGKLGIAADGDADGGHIALLITAALQYFAPEFIQEGRLVRLWSPLWLVKSNGREYYFYDEKDINVKGERHIIKGLGSLSPEQAHRSMFTPEFQHFEPIMLNDDDINLLNALMGKDSAPKKDFVFKNIDFSMVKE